MNRRTSKELGFVKKVEADSTTDTSESRSDPAINSNDQSSSVLEATNNLNLQPCTQSRLHSHVQYYTFPKKRINLLVTKATTNLNPISADIMPYLHTIQTPNSVKRKIPTMTSNSHPKRIRSREIVIADSIAYLDKVKRTLSDQPQLYNEFIDVLKEFKSDVIGTIDLMKRIAHLFKNHSELILDLNAFLPPGYKMKKINDEKDKFVSVFLSFANGTSETMIFYPTDEHVVSSTTPIVTTTTPVTKPPVVIIPVYQDQSKGNITSVLLNSGNQQ